MDDARSLIGGLCVPTQLLEPAYARGLLQRYLRKEGERFVYSGAAFDLQPKGVSAEAWNTFDEDDLVALSFLSMSVYGHHALVC